MKELAILFLKLGTIAFGGPAAHVAMMEEEVVRRREWLTRERFLDLLGAANLIPGPNSTELAIHIGHVRGGWPGLAVAGFCFIVPATLIVMGIAWAYVRYGALPHVGWLLYGVKPVIIAVVAQAIYGLVKTAVKTRWLALLGTVCLVAVLLGLSEIAVLLAAGAVAAIVRWSRSARPHAPPPSLALMLAPAAVAPAGAAGGAGLGALFLTFLKIGSVLYGSGYVLLAFLRSDFVERLGWITEQQLLDAVAVGQVTPGPVFTTATFIGYLVAGPAGAVVATVGIFLPAFLFVALSGPLVPRIRSSPVAGAFLDGVNVASLALMAVVTAQLTAAAVVDVVTLAIAVAGAVLLIRFRVNSLWLVLGGAAAGIAARWTMG